MQRVTPFILILFTSLMVWGEIPERPVPPRLINDYAGVLSPEENNKLENQLEQFARETSTRIVVVTINDLEGYDPGDYAFRLGEQWGVGQRGKDNGLVILLKPKMAQNKGEIFIATGYGLEGILPDAVVNGTIIDAEMIPHFRENNYFAGLENGLRVIMDITRGEYTAEAYRQQHDESAGGAPFLILLFILFFIVIPIIKGRNSRFYSPGKNIPLWIALGMMSGGQHKGTFGNFSSGTGGFGGFGGGSFGGGGAGGSW
jgi:uncharacterized protein